MFSFTHSIEFEIRHTHIFYGWNILFVNQAYSCTIASVSRRVRALPLYNECCLEDKY